MTIISADAAKLRQSQPRNNVSSVADTTKRKRTSSGSSSNLSTNDEIFPKDGIWGVQDLHRR